MENIIIIGSDKQIQMITDSNFDEIMKDRKVLKIGFNLKVVNKEFNIRESDIDLVKNQCENISRDEILKALIDAKGDIVEAIMNLTE